jgi:transcriptional regulator with XRE-family HTH domain
MSAIMNTSSETFAWVDWMVAEREKQGMNQADLARKAGLTRTTISDYEKRIRPNPSVKALGQISEALGYPSNYLPQLAKLIKADPKYDPWVDKTSHKLQQLSPRLREIADRLIDSLIEDEKAKEKPKPKTKPTRA